MSKQHQDAEANGANQRRLRGSEPFIDSPIDFSKLQAAGGPVSYSKQIGYGNAYLSSTVFVSGDEYNQVKITFTNSAGTFPNAIYLNPNNLIQANLTRRSGLMTLFIKEIQLYPPTPDDSGSVYIDATWTDMNGKGSSVYTSSIAVWSNPPTDK